MKIQFLNRISIAFILFFAFALPNVSFAEVLPPTNLVGSPRNSAVFLQWNNSSLATDHIVEYKQSSENTWMEYEEDQNSPNPGKLIENLTNGTTYDFRVSLINGSEESLPSQIISMTPQNNSEANFSNTQIISTGQSNAVGAFAVPFLSTTQPYTNKMLNENRSSFIPLVEPVTGALNWALGETMSSGIANSITYFTGGYNSNYFSIVMSLRGDGGVSYNSLMRGTSLYNELIQDVISAKNLSLAENKTHIVRALTVVHGETDEYSGTTTEQYEDYLLEWQSDYESDIKAITGQEESVPMFTDQMSSSTIYSPSNVPEIALAQYNASKNNPDKIILVTPKYIFDSTDWMSHMTNYSYRRLGEYYAKVYKKVIIDGEQWKPLMPEETTISGNVIHVRFHVPVPPLAFDTTAVLAKANYGFEYSDSTNSAYITNVEIISEDTVAVTLNTVPTGISPRLRYAYSGTSGAWAGSQVPGSARGNLRDSDMTEAPHQDSAVPTYMGNYLHNWALTFDEPVTVAPATSDAPTSVLAVQGQTNGTAVVTFTPPTNTGAGPITGYVVTTTPGSIVATGTGSPITISGLSNNTTYTFSVVAINSAGESLPAISNPVNIHWSNFITVNQMANVLSSVGKKPGPVKPATKKSPRIVEEKTEEKSMIEISNVTTETGRKLEITSTKEKTAEENTIQ